MATFPHIPGYEVKKFLGRGGAADVFMAIDLRHSRIVAIKVMARKIFYDSLQVKRFLKEAETISRLHHPNVLRILATGKTEQLHYMVMEFLPESLKERIRSRNAIPPNETLAIVSQIASALFYAHGKGFVHRDIKPDNIMFRRDGTPVILDFGIARIVESSTNLTRTGTVLGTPRYMSPEQLKAKRADGKSDIYSLGIVLFEMLTGSPPYKGNQIVSVAVKHMTEPIPKLPGDLQAYQPLIERMMAKDPNQRLGTEEEWQALIKPLLRPFRLPRAQQNPFATNVLRDREKTRLSGGKPTRTPTGRAKASDKKRPRLLRHLLLVLALVLLLFFYHERIPGLVRSLWHLLSGWISSLLSGKK